MTTPFSAVPGEAVPGWITPGDAGEESGPPDVLGTWTATRAITSGTGIPAPPSMSLDCAISNTGDTGNGMVAFLSWTLPANYLGADMAVSDDADNVWFPLGAPVCSSPATGLTRSAIWAAPGAYAAGNVYMSPCGLPGPVYPVVMGITITEFANMSPYLGSPAVVTAVANSGTVIAANAGSPSASALMLSVGASDGGTAPTGPGSGWNALTGVSATGGGYYLNTKPAWQISGTATAASYSVGTAADLSAATAVILESVPAPDQPDPDWPAFLFQAGLGAGALTPPGQIAWTDWTSRWLSGEDTTSTSGKQYELDQLEAGEISATLDDDDGALTPDNTSSPYYPSVTADVPLQLLAFWNERTSSVFSGYAERFPVSWDDTWYGMTKTTITDAWSLQQNQLTSVLREETLWDPNLYSYWPCSDAVGSGNAANIVPGNANALQVVPSKYGAIASTQAFGADSGLLPGDPSGSFWEQTGLTPLLTGVNGYCLYGADQSYPTLTEGMTAMGWFAPAGTSQPNTALSLMLAGNAASGNIWNVYLASPSGTVSPGALRMTNFNAGVGTTTALETGNWLEAGVFHIAVEVTTSTWEVFLNGQSVAPATTGQNMTPDTSWLEFMGQSDRFGAGTFINGACAHIAVFAGLLSPDRIQSIYLAGTPDPQTVAGGASQAVTGGQFGGEYPGPRIERLLAYGGWTGPRAISQTSTTEMSGITDIQGDTAVISPSGAVTVSADGQQASQAVNNIVFSDGGFIFVAGTGAICYLSRTDLYVAASQWTLGEDTPNGEIPYLPNAVLGYDKSLLYNGAELTPNTSVSGAPVVATNIASAALHGEYVYNATVYLLLVSQIADLANWIVNTRGVVTLRAEQITVDAAANPDVWEFLLRVLPAQPVTIWRRPQTANYTVTMYPIVAGVTKSIDFQRATATVAITTDSFPEGTVLTAGDPVLGQANGVNILAF